MTIDKSLRINDIGLEGEDVQKSESLIKITVKVF